MTQLSDFYFYDDSLAGKPESKLAFSSYIANSILPGISGNLNKALLEKLVKSGFPDFLF